MSHHHGLWSSLVLYEVGNFMPRFNGSSLWTFGLCCVVYRSDHNDVIDAIAEEGVM